MKKTKSIVLASGILLASAGIATLTHADKKDKEDKTTTFPDWSAACEKLPFYATLYKDKYFLYRSENRKNPNRYHYNGESNTALTWAPFNEALQKFIEKVKGLYKK